MRGELESPPTHPSSAILFLIGETSGTTNAAPASTLLNGTPTSRLPANNLPPFTTRDDAIRLLVSSEETSVAALPGLVPLYKDRHLMERATSAHNVMAEHAAIRRDIAELPAAPDTAATGLTPDETAAQFLKPPAASFSPPTPPRTDGGGVAQSIFFRPLAMAE